MASHTIAQTQRRISTGLDLDVMALSAELARAANAVRNRLEQGPLAEAKLSYSGFLVLWIVWAWQPIETRAIATEAGLGKAALSGVLNTLEKRKLIERTKSKEDGRIIEVSLSEAGRVLLEALLPQVNAAETSALAHVIPSNRVFLTDALKSLSHPGESNS